MALAILPSCQNEQEINHFIHCVESFSFVWSGSAVEIPSGQGSLQPRQGPRHRRLFRSVQRRRLGPGWPECSSSGHALGGARPRLPQSSRSGPVATQGPLLAARCMRIFGQTEWLPDARGPQPVLRFFTLREQMGSW